MRAALGLPRRLASPHTVPTVVLKSLCIPTGSLIRVPSQFENQFCRDRGGCFTAMGWLRGFGVVPLSSFKLLGICEMFSFLGCVSFGTYSMNNPIFVCSFQFLFHSPYVILIDNVPKAIFCGSVSWGPTVLNILIHL